MKIENPIATTDNCRYCLMCRHVCPVGHVTQLETLTPHGWGLTIASVKRGLIEWNEETVGVLYQCADCGTCRSHCVTDQPLPEAISAAREEVVQKKLAPRVVYQLDKALQRWGNPYEEHAPEPVTGQGDVALFVGDAAQYLWPGTARAASQLLEAVGVRPVLIGVGRNNGYLASSLGLRQTAESLARANLEDLKASRAKHLLVLTPGDYFAFNQLYDERLGLEWPRDVVLGELVPFLAERLDAGALKLAGSQDDSPYAYIDPTHSVRVKTRFEAPRRLLSAVLSAPRSELFWRRERAHPCGDVALQFTHPDIARAIAESRLEDARNVGAEKIITEDVSCLSWLNRFASRFDLSVQGLYQLLADHLA